MAEFKISKATAALDSMLCCQPLQNDFAGRC